MHRAILAALALSVVATPALADALTYGGTIGNTPIFVEFSEAPNRATEPFVGRYFYSSQGIDIPLDAVSVTPGRLELAEETPCTEATCVADEEGTIVHPPLGAKWSLTDKADGSIVGTWTDHGKSLPVALRLVGSRPFAPQGPLTPQALYDSILEQPGNFVSGDSTPYDYWRMHAAILVEGDAINAGGHSSYKYVTDPRTKFQYPRVVALGGSSYAADAVNDYLERRHWSLNAAALDCVAQQYAGMGWNGFNASAAGTLGGYEDEIVEVTDLTPTIMSWTESGSLFCGGAHPYNHHEFHNLDVKSGGPLDMTMIFKDWVARDFDGKLVDVTDARDHPDDFQWGPSDELATFLRARYDRSNLADDTDCGYDDLIARNLAISFKQGERVLFALDGLPNAIEACGADLYEAPIVDLKQFLAPSAGDYFASLTR